MAAFGEFLLIVTVALAQSDKNTPDDARAVLPDDLKSVAQFAPWIVRQGLARLSPAERCNIEDISEYRVGTVDFEVGSETDSATANKQVELLDSRVVREVRDARYSRIKIAARPGIPDLTRCWHKSNRIIQIYKTAARCTMNSPCVSYDGFSINVYDLRSR